MGHSSVKLHDFSLCRMWHIMCGLLLLPPRPQLHLKLIYNIAVLTYLSMISRWRFAFQYQTNYDYLHDHLSRIIDLTNFVALVVGHLIVSMELIWRNQSVHIDQQFRQMQHILREKLGCKGAGCSSVDAGFSTTRSVMWHVPIELHDASLRLMRRLMHCLLLLPPRPVRFLQLLYMFTLLMYLGFVFHWRIGFNYHVVYDIQLDQFSRMIDVLNFVVLIACHIVVAMELLWKNRSEEIEQQLERIRYLLRVQFGYKVNLLRIRRYCQGICGSWFLRCLLLFGMTVYTNVGTDVVLLLYYHFYSEVVLLLRFSEFSLYSLLILAFYQELHEVSLNLILELETSSVASLNRLSTLRQVHGILWNTIRTIECNFELSLITVMLKLFVDIFVLPYWIFINVLNQTNTSVVHYILAEEFCKFVEVLVPCLIWNRCELVQREIRSIFHSLNTDRRDVQLNSCLLRISTHLGQESCQFSAGGFLVISNETLGKFIFGMASYVFICIQFRMSLVTKSSTHSVEAVATVAADD
ncbi:hypothetical protein ACLKA6_014407 [Drosophila palustris]